MKRLCVLAFVALGAAGCFVEEDGALYATWSVTEGSLASTCAAVGGDTVEIVSTRLWDGTTLIDKFDCVDLGGTTSGMRPGLYDVSVRLLDASGFQLNDDITVEVRVHSGAALNLGYFNFAFASGGGPLPGGKGRFTATWAVSINGNAASCGDVGAQTFEIVAQAGGAQKTFDFACTAGTATTELLDAGTYVVNVRLLDGTGAMLNDVPVGATVPLAANETKNIGDFEFAFTN
jgi:hypothetical protein